MNVNLKRNILNFDVSGIYRYIPLLTIFFLVLLFFHPIIFQGKTFYAFDCLFSYLPWSPFSNGFQPQNPLITDPVNAFYPPHFYSSHYYYQEVLTSGSFSLWFNSIFSGFPFIHYSYPFSYLFFSFFSITLAHDLFLFMHLFGAGLFTYLYLKKIGLSSIPSTTGAISWMFNGYVMVWFEFEHVPMLAMTLPAVMLFIESWFEKRSVLRFLGLTASLALTICTAYAHLIIYQMLFIGLYMLFRLSVSINKKSLEFKCSARVITGLIFAVVLSIIISANVFISHLMIYKTGQRTPLPYNRLFKETGQLPSKYLSTMLFPDLFGSPSAKVSFKLRSFTPKTNKHQMYNNYNELCIYAGIVTLFLALSCILYFRGNSYIRFFCCSASICLLMAMGCLLYYPLAVIIPGLNLSTPTRILYLFGFSMSILSALGAQLVQKDKNEKKKYILILWLIVLLISVSLIAYLQTDNGIKWAIDPYYLSQWRTIDTIDDILKMHFALSSFIISKPLLIIFTTFIILSSALYAKKNNHKKVLLIFAIILLTYDLFTYGKLYNTASPKFMEFPQTPAIKFLKKDTSRFRIMTFGNFMHNSFIPFGIEDIGGYGSFYPKRYGEYLYKSQSDGDAPIPQQLGRWIFFSKYGSPLLDLLNTKYVLTDSDISIRSDQLKLVYNNEIKIYENMLVFPRVFFVPGYYMAKSKKDAYSILGKFERNDFYQKVILEELPPKDIEFKMNNIQLDKPATLKIISYKQDKIELEVTSPSNGFLVITENYHPDWIARVNREKVEMMRANYIMRAIPVRSGKHIVILEFKPTLMIAGLITTVGGWIILLSAIILVIIKTKILPFKRTAKKLKIV